MSTVVGVFTNRSQAEKAAAKLRSKGVGEESISVVAREGYIHGDDNDTNDSYVEMVKSTNHDEEIGDQEIYSERNTSEEIKSEKITPASEAGTRPDLATGTTAGGAIGGVTGLLAGAGLFTIPGVGPILALGPIVSGLAGAAAGGVTGSLVEMGLTKDRGDYYQAQVEQGGILTAVECDQSKINDIATVFRENGARDVETY